MRRRCYPPDISAQFSTDANALLDREFMSIPAWTIFIARKWKSIANPRKCTYVRGCGKKVGLHRTCRHLFQEDIVFQRTRTRAQMPIVFLGFSQPTRPPIPLGAATLRRIIF